MPPKPTKKTTAKPLQPGERHALVTDHATEANARKGHKEGPNISGAPPKNQKPHIGSEPFALLVRKRRMTEMYVNGYNQEEIAAELDIDRSIISRNLKDLKQQLRTEIFQDLDDLRAREIQAINHTQRLAIEAYIRSMGLEEVKTEGYEETVGENGTHSKTTRKTVTKQLIGDPRYLQQIQQCIELRAKLLGLLKEEKKQTVNVIQINWDAVQGIDTGADEIENQIAALEAMPTLQEVTDAPYNGDTSGGES